MAKEYGAMADIWGDFLDCASGASCKTDAQAMLA